MDFGLQRLGGLVEFRHDAIAAGRAAVDKSLRHASTRHVVGLEGRVQFGPAANRSASASSLSRSQAGVWLRNQVSWRLA